MIQASVQAANKDSVEKALERKHLAGLRHILATRFNKGELRVLCFHLRIDYDDLPGAGRADKARELVAYLERHDRISELVRIGEQLRPDTSWDDTPKAPPERSLIKKRKGLERNLLPLVGLLVVTCLLTVLIPVSGARWTKVLSVSGTVHTAASTPTPTATPITTPDSNNCTYTMGYWKNHPQAWPVEDIAIGGVTYAKEAAIAILETEPGGDATYILAQQLIAAKLNILNGADPITVETTVTDADGWLSAHLLGSDPSNPERAQGIALAEALDGYNNGVIGPGHCNDETITAAPEPAEELILEPTATPTPGATATRTPEPTATPLPEPSATPTPEPTATPLPEPTATPTPEPTATPTPEPTATPTPEPTATPTPEPTATVTPEPTATPTPEPTATPTPEPTTTPEPTATPTLEPTATPTPEPTMTPTPEPTTTPTAEPTEEPAPEPTEEPTEEPTPT